MDFKQLHSSAKIPTRQTPGAAGYDLHAIEDALVYAKAVIGTGVAVKIPDGHVGLIRDRSGLAVNKGLTVLAGVIDADYSGELKVVLSCVSSSGDCVKAGERIAQLVVVPCLMEDSMWVADFAETDRGANGFGSTGAT